MRDLTDLRLRLKFFLETYGEEALCEATQEVLSEQSLAKEQNFEYWVMQMPKDYSFAIMPDFYPSPRPVV